jgi:hypothetical protein
LAGSRKTVVQTTACQRWDIVDMSIVFSPREVDTARPERARPTEQVSAERREWVRGGFVAGALLTDVLAIAAVS